MANEIKKIKVGSIDYSIIDEGAARLEDLPVGEVNLTLTETSISDGTTTLTVPDASNFVTTNTDGQTISGQKIFTSTVRFDLGGSSEHNISSDGIRLFQGTVELDNNKLKFNQFRISNDGTFTNIATGSNFILPPKSAGALEPPATYTLATTDDITTAIGNAIAASY